MAKNNQVVQQRVCLTRQGTTPSNGPIYYRGPKRSSRTTQYIVLILLAIVLLVIFGFMVKPAGALGLVPDLNTTEVLLFGAPLLNVALSIVLTLLLFLLVFLFVRYIGSGLN